MTTRHGHPPADAVATEDFLHETHALRSQPGANARHVAKAAFTRHEYFINNKNLFREPQALRCCVAIRPREPACAKLDSAKPAPNQHHDAIALLSVYRLQNGASRRTAWFAVVTETVLLPDSIGPAMMTGIGDTMFVNKSQCRIRCLHGVRKRHKAAFSYFLVVRGQASKRIGVGHAGIKRRCPVRRGNRRSCPDNR